MIGKTTEMIKEVAEKAMEKSDSRLIVLAQTYDYSKDLKHQMAEAVGELGVETTFLDGNALQFPNGTQVIFRGKDWSQSPAFKYQPWDGVFKD